MIIDARKANKKHIVASGVGIKRTDIATPIAEINAHDAIILLIIVIVFSFINIPLYHRYKGLASYSQVKLFTTPRTACFFQTVGLFSFHHFNEGARSLIVSL